MVDSFLHLLAAASVALPYMVLGYFFFLLLLTWWHETTKKIKIVGCTREKVDKGIFEYSLKTSCGYFIDFRALENYSFVAPWGITVSKVTNSNVVSFNDVCDLYVNQLCQNIAKNYDTKEIFTLKRHAYKKYFLRLKNKH